MKKTGKLHEIILLVLAAAVIIALILNSTIYYFRADLTEEKIFTISEVSERVFDGLDDRVNITYYVSEKLENYSTIPSDVQDLLDEYRAHAGGKISVKVIDPAEKGLERQVETLGITPRQIEIVEKNEKSYANIYTGILIQYLDSYEVLPFVVSTETLEYEITRIIRGFVDPEETRIAVLLGDSTRSLDKDFSGAWQQLSRSFLLTEVHPGEGIDPDTDVLVVFGNHDLTDNDLVSIDDFVMAGGNTLFCVDGVFIDMFQNLAATKEENSPLLEMLESYGVRVEPKLVLDAYCRDFRLPRQIFGQIAWQMLGPYPHWVTILPVHASTENPVTARLNGLDLLWPSPLILKESETVKAEVLISSSPKAWTMQDSFITDPYRGSMMMQIREGDTEAFDLAAVLTGSFPRYTGDTDERSESCRMMVIGDADFASNMVQYSDSMYNFLFLENAVEWLSNDDDMLEIKTRSLTDPRLNRQDPERARSIYMTAQIVNVVLIPLMVLLFGIMRGRRRKKQRKEV